MNKRLGRHNNFANVSGLKLARIELIQGARPHEAEILDASKQTRGSVGD